MKIKRKIAKNWNELSKNQLARIARLMTKKNSPKNIDVVILKTVINLRWWQFISRVKSSIALRWIKIEELAENYSWIYNTCNRTKFIKLKNRTKPGDRLNNLSIAEFSVTEDLFQLYWKTKDLDYIHYLATVLYVPCNFQYPERPDFVKEKLENQAKKFKTTKRQRLAILMCYLGCKEHLAKTFPYVFPKEKQEQTNQFNIGLDPVILELSGQKFGPHADTKSTNIYVFLEEFNNKLKEYENAKSRN